MAILSTSRETRNAPTAIITVTPSATGLSASRRPSCSLVCQVVNSESFYREVSIAQPAPAAQPHQQHVSAPPGAASISGLRRTPGRPGTWSLSSGTSAPMPTRLTQSGPHATAHKSAPREPPAPGAGCPTHKHPERGRWRTSHDLAGPSTSRLPALRSQFELDGACSSVARTSIGIYSRSY